MWDHRVGAVPLPDTGSRGQAQHHDQAPERWPETSHSLSLPAIKDTEWTPPIPLDIPREQSHAIIEVVVLHQGRTVQVATLSGPVLDRSDPVGSEGLMFAIDVDTPVHGLEFRAPLLARLTIKG